MAARVQERLLNSTNILQAIVNGIILHKSTDEDAADVVRDSDRSTLASAAWLSEALNAGWHPGEATHRGQHPASDPEWNLTSRAAASRFCCSARKSSSSWLILTIKKFESILYGLFF